MRNVIFAALLAASSVCLPAKAISGVYQSSASLGTKVPQGQVGKVLKAVAHNSSWSYGELRSMYAKGRVEVELVEAGYLVRVGEGGGTNIIIFIEDLF